MFFLIFEFLVGCTAGFSGEVCYLKQQPYCIYLFQKKTFFLSQTSPSFKGIASAIYIDMKGFPLVRTLKPCHTLAQRLLCVLN